MAKWNITGIVVNHRNGMRSTKSVKISASTKEEAIQKGLKKLGTKDFESARLISA